MSKQTKNTTLALAVSTPTNQVLDILRAKLEDLKFIETSVFKAGKTLAGIIIQEEKDPLKLDTALSVAWAKTKAYEAVQQDLGVDTYPVFKVEGATYEEWKHDVQLKKAIINQKETHDKLKEFEKKIQSFMSEAEQKQIVFEDLKAFLQNI